MASGSMLFSFVVLSVAGLKLTTALDIGDVKCSKFMYEQQLLEKMVRLEFFVENMEKEMRKMVDDVQTKLKRIEGAAADGSLGSVGSIGSGMGLGGGPLVTTDTGTKTIIEYRDNGSTEKMKKDIQNHIMNIIDVRFHEIENKTLPKLDKKFGDLIRLEQKLRAPNVAFSATNVKESPAAKHDPVVFTAVLLNDGAGYNLKTGFFIAPISGVYQFTSQLCAHKPNDLEYAIKVDSRRIVAGEFRIPANSLDGKCTSFYAIALVRRRQKVSVQGWGTPLFNNDNDWNTFSGSLLYKLD